MLEESQSEHGEVNLLVLLAAFLGLGMIIFAILAVMEFGDSHQATATLSTQKQQAYASGQAAQKAADDQASAAAKETPYRIYTAPAFAGSFVISFPKDWSAAVTESESASTQVDLRVNPDFVTTQGQATQPVAVHVRLLSQPATQINAGVTANPAKGLKISTVTVSGIQSSEYIGPYDQTHTGTMVVVPVRDKSLVFYNEDAKYASEFSQVLAQAKINP